MVCPGLSGSSLGLTVPLPSPLQGPLGMKLAMDRLWKLPRELTELQRLSTSGISCTQFSEELDGVTSSTPRPRPRPCRGAGMATGREAAPGPRHAPSSGPASSRPWREESLSRSLASLGPGRPTEDSELQRDSERGPYCATSLCSALLAAAGLAAPSFSSTWLRPSAGNQACFRAAGCACPARGLQRQHGLIGGRQLDGAHAGVGAGGVPGGP